MWNLDNVIHTGRGKVLHEDRRNDTYWICTLQRFIFSFKSEKTYTSKEYILRLCTIGVCSLYTPLKVITISKHRTAAAAFSLCHNKPRWVNMTKCTEVHTLTYIGYLFRAKLSLYFGYTKYILICTYMWELDDRGIPYRTTTALWYSWILSWNCKLYINVHSIVHKML